MDEKLLTLTIAEKEFKSLQVFLGRVNLSATEVQLWNEMVEALSQARPLQIPSNESVEPIEPVTD